MKHLLSVYVGAQRKTKEVEESLFSRAQQARETLKAQHAIEARFDNLLNNYISFESSLAHILVSHTLRIGSIFDPTDETHAEISRHLSNFLSSAGGYKSECIRQKPNGQAMRLIFSERKKLSPYFRIAEGLRNHDQHFALLVHVWSLPMRWSEDRKKRYHGIGLSLNIPQFSMDTRVEEEVLTELNKLVDDDKNVQLLPITRKYLEELSSVHFQVRSQLSSDFQYAKAAIENLLQIAIDLGAKRDSSAELYKINSIGVAEESFWINDNLTVAIEALRKKNTTPNPDFGLVEFFL